MAGRTAKTFFYKQAEFLTAPDFNAKELASGLSVRYNQSFFDHDLFRNNFRSDFLTILLIVKGGLEFYVNLDKYKAIAGGLVIILPNAVKKVEFVSKNTIISGVNFTWDFLISIGMPKNSVELMDYFTSHFSPYWQLEPAEAVSMQQLMGELEKRVQCLDADYFGKEILFHNFYIFLYEVYNLGRKYGQTVQHHISRKENLVRNFTQLAQKQFRVVRNVDSYARQLHITAKYLTETVKEITGKTAGEIIDDLVLFEAKLLLDNPALSIAEISNELHFSDQSFFGKYFKRHTGLSPREFRRSGN